jgi:hypothetical protein
MSSGCCQLTETFANLDADGGDCDLRRIQLRNFRCDQRGVALIVRDFRVLHRVLKVRTQAGSVPVPAEADLIAHRQKASIVPHIAEHAREQYLCHAAVLVVNGELVRGMPRGNR